MAATATERPTVVSSNLLRQLILTLSMSRTSRVIVKHGAGSHQKHQSRAAAGGGAFPCKTCGRAFRTFQALGGHRTSHKRPLVRAQGLDLLLGARPGKGAATAAIDVHRCGSCGAVFPTGQALGGHMRRHRAAATFGFEVAVHGETAKLVDELSGEKQAESEDDDVEPIRLFKFI